MNKVYLSLCRAGGLVQCGTTDAYAGPGDKVVEYTDTNSLVRAAKRCWLVGTWPSFGERLTQRYARGIERVAEIVRESGWQPLTPAYVAAYMGSGDLPPSGIEILKYLRSLGKALGLPPMQASAAPWFGVVAGTRLDGRIESPEDWRAAHGADPWGCRETPDYWRVMADWFDDQADSTRALLLRRLFGRR